MDLGLSGSIQPLCDVLTNLVVFKKLENRMITCNKSINIKKDQILA